MAKAIYNKTKQEKKKLNLKKHRKRIRKTEKEISVGLPQQK